MEHNRKDEVKDDKVPHASRLHYSLRKGWSNLEHASSHHYPGLAPRSHRHCKVHVAAKRELRHA
ncbi:hypothetical protein CH063_07491 [Colletotrichum higginsianum]|uniref:Uncharacterized protein n=1 Tax=Colletotrichum higginsianum (strain IMI 349063) TaxID=759273 RepID=H1V6D2_COLHI|nr:hypothetical protein CH063_07491 [Colletotrichum higginsianum]